MSVRKATKGRARTASSNSAKQFNVLIEERLTKSEWGPKGDIESGSDSCGLGVGERESPIDPVGQRRQIPHRDVGRFGMRPGRAVAIDPSAAQAGAMRAEHVQFR